MSVVFLLIPLSIAIAACFLGAFIWAVRSGQYEDTCTPSMRVLLDDPSALSVSRAATVSPSPLNGERAGVRGASDKSVQSCQNSGLQHPSPSLPLLVEGRGKGVITRFGIIHAARCEHRTTIFRSIHS